MGFLRTVKYRLRALTRKAHLDQDMEDEMRFHIEMLAKEHEANGLSASQARRRARIEFGGMEKMKENMREARGVMWIENIVRDGGLALRQMKKSPGFTAVALATLGLGIGACATMFSIVNTVLLKPLPFENPEELVWIQNYRSNGLSGQTTRVDNFLDWHDQNDSFESIGGYNAFFDYSSFLLANESGNGSDRIRGVGVTIGFMETLGVKPMLGRIFNERELQEPVVDAPKVAILQYDYWKSRFAGDPNTIGSVVRINGHPTEIIGVMPASFDFDSVFTPGTEIQMLTPFPAIEQTMQWGNMFAVIGRLKPGVTREQGQADLRVITERIRTDNLNTGRFYHEANTDMLDDRIRGSFRIAFYVLSGAVACVLVIACVNLANLLIARANSRRKEFALRSALGAKRSRLIQQTLTESFILAIGGCILGIAIAYLATGGIAGLQAFNIPMLKTVEVDIRSIVFVISISCLAGLVCGILPALQLSDRQPADALRDDSQRGTAGRRTGIFRKFLVVTEVALACSLLIGAGLLIRSFESLMETDIGFKAENTVAWRIDGDRTFETRAGYTEYYNAVAEHVAQLPGVVAAGLTDTLPLGRNRTWGANAKGENNEPGRESYAFPRIVNYGYAEALGIPVVDGRFFNAFDTSETQYSIVINEEMAKQLWDDENPIGKIVEAGNGDAEVIGVVQNVKHSSLDADPTSEMYFSMRQQYDFGAVELTVRSRMPTTLLVNEIRAALQDYDATLSTEDYKLLKDIVDKSVAPQRLIMSVLSGFSVVALLLAGIGLYGVISYTVNQRSKEIGIRMAIGAKQSTVLKMIMTEGFSIIVIGIIIGLGVAFACSRYLSSLLFEVAATDPTVFSVNALIVMAIALLATVIPARRAMKLNPIAALRSE